MRLTARTSYYSVRSKYRIANHDIQIEIRVDGMLEEDVAAAIEEQINVDLMKRLRIGQTHVEFAPHQYISKLPGDMSGTAINREAHQRTARELDPRIGRGPNGAGPDGKPGRDG